MCVKFENDVKMYGTQTLMHTYRNQIWFENDVKMYGTQTYVIPVNTTQSFENDVKMYGTQTRLCQRIRSHRLRMM